MFFKKWPNSGETSIFFGSEWFGKKNLQHTLQKQLHQTQNYVSDMRSANRSDCSVIHVRQTAHILYEHFGSMFLSNMRCTTQIANGRNWMNMFKIYLNVLFQIVKHVCKIIACTGKNHMI